ncbi:KAP family P-loop NTPase fold protein [Echinicola vietnamensis]|uniref:Putative P-loop ATPase n=1 Tax=Echinicola vietnamensis (strain DSM 17526 / LMG 23754 / KMM 6221) TaxID=926556 RepID=L0FXZ7_ECHVK|nr:P-loop ATPase [Echinicola vietnamensis]AGA77621.1 putative P-loop ATPase [Echinicola vietnamensis DSM 17526]
MWSDNDTVIDLLDYQYLISATENIISNDTLLPCTIGIYGDWGSGKSSLMRMVEESLRSDDKILTIKFNGWLFEGYEDAKSVLMGTILEEIGENRTLKGDAKKLFSKMLKQVDYMKVAKSLVKHGISFAAGGPAGLAITGMGDLISLAQKINPQDYVKAEEDTSKESLRMSIRKFHEDFSKLLQDLKIEKLVIFIDDLDRCNTDTVIDTLEAIKLFLYVPNSAFVICADEKIIEYAVRRRFPEIPGRGLEVASAYLEKLIQFPIRLPRLNETELETYINLLFAQLYVEHTHFQKICKEVIYEKSAEELQSKKLDHDYLAKALPSVSEELQKAMLLTRQITPILTVGLDGNPRQSKRFMNMLMMRIGMANSKKIELEIRILAKLMLLEYFKKETFIKLHEYQAEQGGKPKEIRLLEARLIADKNKNSENKIETVSIIPEVEIWEKDDWITQWVNTEPKLTDVDLGPYFYFSRDRLNSMYSTKQQMSSQALTVYHDLVSGSDVYEKKSLQEASSLSPSDSSSIFEELKEKLLQESNGSASTQNFKLLFGWTNVRKELTSQLLTFLKGIPHETIPTLAVTELLKVIKGTAFEKDGTDIIKEWAQSESNKDLSKIASNRIKPKK